MIGCQAIVSTKTINKLALSLGVCRWDVLYSTIADESLPMLRF
jgi:hypothetical protein